MFVSIASERNPGCGHMAAAGDGQERPSGLTWPHRRIANRSGYTGASSAWPLYAQWLIARLLLGELNSGFYLLEKPATIRPGVVVAVGEKSASQL